MSTSELVPVSRWALLKPWLPTSPPQVLTYLKAKGYRIPSHRTTRKPTTNDEGLEVLIRQHPSDEILPRILLARHLVKAQGYLGENIVGKDDRLHPRYTVLPKTGRLSSKRPNMMNIPQGRKGDIMKEVAEKIREAIIPSEGYELGEFDWRAIEALLTGFFAGDPDFMLAAKIGVHDIFASHILSKRGIIPAPKSARDPDVLSGEWAKWLKGNHDFIRAMAKKRIYAGSYGQGAYNMARDLQCSVREVKELDEVFAQMAPKVIKWQSDTRMRAHAEGRLENPFSYVMTFFEVYRKAYKDDGSFVWVPGKEANEALAFLPQSTCAAMLRDTLVTLGNDSEEGTAFRLLVPTHDSISFEIKLGERDRIMQKVQGLMTRPWAELNGLSVDVEGKVGMSFRDMKGWNG